MHVLLAQICPVAHIWLQAPQWFALLVVSTQPLPQST
jgi:hypothetical protein